jgi:hypothetical protein
LQPFCSQNSGYPGRSQIDPTRVAVEQPDAQFSLEPADLRGQARLGYPQALRGAREAALLGDRNEVAKVTEFHELSCAALVLNIASTLRSRRFLRIV